MAKDYYGVLGVPRTASDKEIRAAYRRLARKHHPDVNPEDKAAEERFKAINEAHEVLSDPEKRRLYDRYGPGWKQAQSFEGSPGQPGQPPFGRTPRQDEGIFDLFGDLSESPEDIIGRFFGGAGRGGAGTAARRHRVAATHQAEVTISLEEAHAGTRRLLEMPMAAGCPPCSGSGRVGGAICSTCQGRGRVLQQSRLEVTIPPGIEDGAQVRITPHGQEVLVRVAIQSHPRFRRQDSDLSTEVSVPLYDALLGGEVLVPILKGQVALTIPPETQNGQVFQLKGRGMPRISTPGVTGDLYVTIRVVLPAKLTLQERELLERLRGFRDSAGKGARR
ncbi:MAG: J domain-containing protein [Chloroflexi bacterium]|nr:J domain-containing protein [Chloroflexota bacterium]